MKLKISDIRFSDRPRERIIRNGASTLADYELLAALISTGYGRDNALTLSQKILKKYTLNELSSIDASLLSKIPGIGMAKSCQIAAAFELGRRIRSDMGKECIINGFEDVVSYLSPNMENLDREHFIIMLLDTRHRLIKAATISIGILDSSIIHPREVFKKAITESASAIILAHNHPSGDPSPSEEDIEVTRIIKDAGKTLGIQVLDHIIIGKGKNYSFSENGLI